MFSGLLRSETAIQANILIMRAFVAMRRFLVANAQIFQRLDRLDRKQLENEQKFEKVFAKFEENEPRRQGIFYASFLSLRVKTVLRVFRERMRRRSLWQSVSRLSRAMSSS